MDLAARDFAGAAGKRVLPHSLEAEASVIGGILLRPEAFVQVAELVSADDFYHPAHEAIFRAMVRCDETGKPIDALTVHEQMRADETDGKLRAVNGESYFAELMARVQTIENIAFHAKMVRGNATRRRMILAGQEISARGYGDAGELDQYIEVSERVFFDVTHRHHTGTVDAVGKLLGQAIRRVEERYDRKGRIPGVPTTYTKVDAMTGGHQRKLFYVLAGRPSMGKTAMALCRMRRSAKEHNVPHLFFSLDSSKEEVVDRLMAQEARIDTTRLRDGYLDQRDFLNLTRAGSILSEIPIWVDDTSALTMLALRSKARRWRADRRQGGLHPEGAACIWLDYLTLMDPQKAKGESDAQAFGRMAEGMKALAKELDCAVVALCQLNRGVESRADKRPNLADLRESGAIEQAANVVEFLYRDEVYNPQSPDQGVAEVIIAKQKDGPTGTVRLAFLAPYLAFENLAERDDA